MNLIMVAIFTAKNLLKNCFVNNGKRMSCHPRLSMTTSRKASIEESLKNSKKYYIQTNLFLVEPDMVDRKTRGGFYDAWE